MCAPAARRSRISTGSDVADLTDVLVAQVRSAADAGRPLRIVGGDTKAFLGRPVVGDPLRLAAHTGVTDYDPSELVFTARAGTPLAEIETLLHSNGQMLAFEPPSFGPDSTIGGVVAAGLAGPRRPFAGAVRDSLLGVKVLDGRGRVLRFGGTVFKNVAGFDAFRLMAGAMGRLGVLLEVSVRVAPSPPTEVSRSFEVSWPRAQTWIAALMRRPIPLSGAAYDGARLHLRFSGGPASVEQIAAELGGDKTADSFWPDLRHCRHPIFEASRLWRLSAARTAPLDELPGPSIRDWAGGQIWLESTAEPEAIRNLARSAGGHATLWRGVRSGEAAFAPLPAPLLALHRRLALAFDPAGVLNPGRMYEEL